jgi:hypothetical protein
MSGKLEFTLSWNPKFVRYPAKIDRLSLLLLVRQSFAKPHASVAFVVIYFGENISVIEVIKSNLLLRSNIHDVTEYCEYFISRQLHGDAKPAKEAFNLWVIRS